MVFLRPVFILSYFGVFGLSFPVLVVPLFSVVGGTLCADFLQCFTEVLFSCGVWYWLLPRCLYHGPLSFFSSRYSLIFVCYLITFVMGTAINKT